MKPCSYLVRKTSNTSAAPKLVPARDLAPTSVPLLKLLVEWVGVGALTTLKPSQLCGLRLSSFVARISQYTIMGSRLDEEMIS